MWSPHGSLQAGQSLNVLEQIPQSVLLQGQKWLRFKNKSVDPPLYCCSLAVVQPVFHNMFKV